MPDTPHITKAELRELDSNGKETGDRSHWMTVQFNPDTLKVSYANQVAPPNNPSDQRGSAAIQYVGKGTTKLTVQLWFDLSGVLPEAQKKAQDVRELTKKVAYFITPQPAPDDNNKLLPPGIRFLWGTFQFDGIMEALEESLEFFSAEGVPLRASMSLNLTQQAIQFQMLAPPGGRGGPGTTTPGARPQSQAKAGDTVQGLASGQGLGGNWQAIAAANGIENPRLLAPGQILDLNAGVSGGVSLGGGLGASLNANLSASVSLGGASGSAGFNGGSIV